MDDTHPSSAPSNLRPGAEIIGFITGLSAILLNEVTRTLPVGRPFFLAHIGSILGLAALAALVATQLGRWTDIHRLRATGMGAHLGLRAGLVVGLVAGAACCASALIHTRWVNYTDEESAEKVRLWATFFVSVAGILPSACLGLVVGSLSATLRECAQDGKSFFQPAALDIVCRRLPPATSGTRPRSSALGTGTCWPATLPESSRTARRWLPCPGQPPSPFPGQGSTSARAEMATGRTRGCTTSG